MELMQLQCVTLSKPSVASLRRCGDKHCVHKAMTQLPHTASTSSHDAVHNRQHMFKCSIAIEHQQPHRQLLVLV